MKKYLLISLIVVGGIFTTLYIYLGGTDELAFVVDQQEMWFAGESIQTRYSNPKIEELFINAREIAAKNDGYSLAVINRPAGKDSVNQTIGILSYQPIDQSDSFKESKHFNSKSIKTIIRAHNLVMPKPGEVKKQAKNFATTNGLKINTTWTLEVYKSARNLEVFIPLQD